MPKPIRAPAPAAGGSGASEPLPRFSFAWGTLKPWQTYVIATVATVATLGLRLALEVPLAGRPTMVMFTMPIMLSAYLGGLRAGLLATGLTCLFTSYYLLPPIHSFMVESVIDRWQLFAIGVTGVVISALNESLHRARRLVNLVIGEQDRARTALLKAEGVIDAGDHLRKRGQAALRENDALLRTIHLHSIVSIADRAGRIVEVNAGFCNISGYSRDELVGQTHRVINSGVHDSAFWTGMWHSIAGGVPWRGEICNRNKDGALYWVDSIIVPFTGEDGRTTKYLSIRTNITAAKLAAEKLRKVIDGLGPNTFLGLLTVEGVLIEANRAALVAAGLSRADVLGKPFDQTHWWSHSEPARDELRAAMARAAAGEPSRYEVQILVAEGNVVWIDFSLNPVHDAAGRVIYLVPSGNVITGLKQVDEERKQVEEEREKLDQSLRDQQYYTRSLIESSIDALMTTDARGIITDVNMQTETLTGCTRDELIGAPFKNHFTDPQRAEAGIGLVLSQKKVTNYELTARNRDGNETVVSYNATTIYDRERKLQGVFVAARDITERKQYEQSLREATYKAEQASRAKSDFLANMSHEIRTPMNAVIGLSYLMGKTKLSKHQAAFLAKINLSTKSLLVLLNNVLDVSKIEAGELIVEHAAFSPRHLLKELTYVMAVQADAKGITFEIDAADDLPAALDGDAGRLTQILTNLLSNAIKFTERGGVTLRVRPLAATPDRVTLVFVVHDTGIGIAPAVQAQLFTPFAQADASITRRFGGTGLGLSIVKRLVNLMGGTVSLDSAPGSGSDFSVVLEFALAAPEALARLETKPAARGENALRGVRVLVVDDSEINLEVTRRILELEGAQVMLANNGQEALDRLAAEPRGVDVVLMDVQMPVLDGVDATRRIRRDLKLVALPIIALTAGALSSERQRAAAAGMDDFILKPFDADALVCSILRHVAPAGDPLTRQTGAAPVTQANLQPPWPQIEGIDSVYAQAWWGDDFGLFLSLVQRMLDEFADVDIPESARDPAALGDYAKRMHKLSGGACVLGAKVIHQLAREAEAACVADDVKEAAGLAGKLAIQLELLRQGTLAVSGAAPNVPAEAALPVAGELDPQDMADFVALLRRQSLSAVERFSTLSPQLVRLLGRDSYELVRACVNNLQFSEAARELATYPR
jgi:PAS domain S-box-containing protein